MNFVYHSEIRYFFFLCGDVQVQPQTECVEIKLQGQGPWNFLGPDIDLIFTPGHTRVSSFANSLSLI